MGELYRRDEETHRLRLTPPGTMVAQLRDAGFEVRVLDGYGEMRFPRGLACFLARRKP
ncbi:hypothetical protein [Rubrobacter marinus]|uniref:hypothetical protein n=1 Tax=Rubrobacter marinus TaxID=2653852 RepID=UPI00140A6A12|nr:hypothetical protein [Rubrobacter marinus]